MKVDYLPSAKRGICCLYDNILWILNLGNWTLFDGNFVGALEDHGAHFLARHFALS